MMRGNVRTPAMMTALFALSLSVAAALSAPALAATKAAGPTFENRAVIRLHGGVSFPVGNFGDAFSTGFGFGGSLGYGLSDNVIVSWGVSHHQFEDENSAGIDWSVTPLVMNADYRIPGSGSVAPWIGGGIGLYMVDAEFPAGGGTIREEDFNNFGLNFGGGISTPIGARSAFLGGLRFHWVAGDEGIIDTPFVTAQVGVGFVL